jgi:hypothetical protein
LNTIPKTSSSSSISVTSGYSGIDTISFLSKNVGAGDRTVTLDSVTVSSANSNYDFTLTGNSTSTIDQLASVTWVGGASGEWFDPAKKQH